MVCFDKSTSFADVVGERKASSKEESNRVRSRLTRPKRAARYLIVFDGPETFMVMFMPVNSDGGNGPGFGRQVGAR